MPEIAKKPKKEKKAKKVIEKEKEKKKEKKERYLEAVGRRKTSVARVRLFKKGKGELIINGKDLGKYFPSSEVQKTVLAPLQLLGLEGKFNISVIVKGGGIFSQSEAVRHGIARVLLLFNEKFRKQLKKAGFLKRDPRMRERKKFGLKRARRAPQWQKR